MSCQLASEHPSEGSLVRKSLVVLTPPLIATVGRRVSRLSTRVALCHSGLSRVFVSFPSARPFGRTFSIARASLQFASEHPTEGYLVRRSLVGSTIVPCQWAHHRPRSHVSCHAGPAGPKARRGGYLVGGRRSTYDLRVRVRKQGVVSFVAEQWKMHACKSQQRMVQSGHVFLQGSIA